MIIVKQDEKERFASIFNPATGAYIRTGILDENGLDTNIDPFKASFPELIDIGIMGNCEHGKSGLCYKSGVQCYQSGLTKSQPNMPLDSFKRIVDECAGKVFQFALGGRGDPDMHEDIEEILKYSRDHNIVPNFTTSGFGFTEDKMDMCKGLVGALAVSWYRNNYTINTINKLIEKGLKTNIHYVLGTHTIDEAIDLISNDKFPQGINAVIFLLHKPVGLGSNDYVFSVNDSKLKHFFDLIDNNKYRFKIGFDSCTVPAIVNLTKNIDGVCFDTCEGARFSCYISPDMVMVPCSFDQDRRWGVSLENHTIQEVWDSDQFNDFRNRLSNACPQCEKRELCMGGCPVKPNIVLCDKK
jgi:radical SAM protein with 4Fe4S-binding SPASM domain